MNILVDTCVWSLALRRESPKESPNVKELTELIKEARVKIIGPIRQELLSGIRVKVQFDFLRDYLSAFPDLPLQTEHFELAADFFNQCRRKGIQGSNTDYLLCAIAYYYNLLIFTEDQDFQHFQEQLPIHLYTPRFQ